ncbi:MAG: hypothetical protein RIT25_137 [Planctomycetota bacterium]
MAAAVARLHHHAMRACTLAVLALACCAGAHAARAQEAGTPQAPQQAAPPAAPKGWTVRTDLQASLPRAVVVYERVEAKPPLRAFLVSARFDGTWRPEASQPARGLLTTSQQAGALGALVAVNAGYFVASGSVSAVVDEGVLVAKGAATVKREAHAHPVARAAIGFAEDEHGAHAGVDCAWTWCFDDALFALDAPAANAPGKPAPAPQRSQGRPWRAQELLGGGPMLVEKGLVRITEAEECFEGIGGGARHPRTAAGWTKDGRLLLLVVEGRSKASRGATLAETAQMLLEHGAEEALNLDGGGSTTLWVAGTRISQPSDEKGERPVASILALVPQVKDRPAK